MVLHLLPTNDVTTFNEYACRDSCCFLPHISRHLQKCTRVGVAWDTYRNDSIKPATREKRGKEMRRKVSGGNNKVPGNWRDFLQAKLFGFLSQKSVTLDYPKRLFIHLMLMYLPKGPVMVWYHVIKKKQTPGC